MRFFRWVILVIAMIVWLCVSSKCSDILELYEYSDPANYEEIWSLSEQSIVETMLFPESIEHLDVEQFYLWDATYTLIGHGFQIVLTVNYSEEEFAEEVQRISLLEGEGGKIRYNTEDFAFPAYVTTWLWPSSAFEYALINEESRQICYIYLQSINGDDDRLKLQDWQLPRGYSEFHQGDTFYGDSFCIYSSWSLTTETGQ